MIRVWAYRCGQQADYNILNFLFFETLETLETPLKG